MRVKLLAFCSTIQGTAKSLEPPSYIPFGISENPTSKKETFMQKCQLTFIKQTYDEILVWTAQ